MSANPTEIHIRDPTGEDKIDRFYRIKKSCKLEVVLDDYAYHNYVRESYLQFLWNGQRVKPTQTPGELKMGDEVFIDCMGMDSARLKMSSEPINIQVNDQKGEETFFKIRKNAPMERVFNAYATKNGVRASSLQFLLSGKPIHPTQTPEMLDLDEYYNQIDCMELDIDALPNDIHSAGIQLATIFHAHGWCLAEESEFKRALVILKAFPTLAREEFNWNHHSFHKRNQCWIVSDKHCPIYHFAAAPGVPVETIRAVHELCPDLLDTPVINGDAWEEHLYDTPLHIACEFGASHETIEYLFDTFYAQSMASASRDVRKVRSPLELYMEQVLLSKTIRSEDEYKRMFTTCDLLWRDVSHEQKKTVLSMAVAKNVSSVLEYVLEKRKDLGPKEFLDVAGFNRHFKNSYHDYFSTVEKPPMVQLRENSNFEAFANLANAQNW